MARQIKDSWLKEYLRYTSHQESPDLFHLWVGLSLIATCLNREVWIDQGYFKVYPNQYIILVAGSQRCRKTVAIDIGTAIINMLPEEHKLPVLSQKLTPEALIGALQPVPVIKGSVVKQVSSGLLVASELSVLIDKQARHSGLLAILVDLYDCRGRWTYLTKIRGEEELINVYINMLAGSSPEYLRLSLPYDEIGGGMLARTIFVYQQAPKARIPWPQHHEEEKKCQDRLVNDLTEIRKLSGEFEITPGARKWYSDWYINLDPRIPHPALAPYYHKKENHVLKVAQLISVAESNNLVIDEVHLKMALEILEQTEQGLPYVLGELVSSQTGYKSQVVMNTIAALSAQGNRVTMAALMNKLRHVMDIDELKKALETLVASGQINESLSIQGKGGNSYGLEKESK